MHASKWRTRSRRQNSDDVWWSLLARCSCGDDQWDVFAPAQSRHSQLPSADVLRPVRRISVGSHPARRQMWRSVRCHTFARSHLRRVKKMFEHVRPAEQRPPHFGGSHMCAKKLWVQSCRCLLVKNKIKHLRTNNMHYFIPKFLPCANTRKCLSLYRVSDSCGLSFWSRG